MKIPKTQRRYCPFCRKHTEQKVAHQKFTGLNKAHPQTKGSKVRTKKRGRRAGTGNKGRFSRPALAKWKRTGAKTSKKTDLRFTCQECKKAHVQRKSKRSKKIEFK